MWVDLPPSIKIGVSLILQSARCHARLPTRRNFAACKEEKEAEEVTTKTYLETLACQRIRKRVEEIFGWIKTVGGFRKTRFRGTERTQLTAWWVGAAYNLLRMAKLVA